MLSVKSRSAIESAFELFIGRRAAVSSFDMSVEGFWHSFRAFFYVLPFFAVNAAVEHGTRLADSITDDAPASAFIAARLIDYGLDWVMMPILLALFASRLGITRSYVPYIIVRNWSLIVMAAPQALVSLLLGTGIIGFDFAAALSLIILVVMVTFHYRIIRLTMNRSFGFSIGLVAADIVLSLVLSEVIDRLFGL